METHGNEQPIWKRLTQNFKEMNKKDKALLELADSIIFELYDFLSNVVYDPDSEKPDKHDVERMNSCTKYLKGRGYNVEPYKQP